jgi:hypothetical protein
MDLTPLIPIVAIAAFTVIRLAKIKAGHPAQERLDFAERLLSTGRDERGPGS